jgi:chromosome segregation ATPase
MQSLDDDLAESKKELDVSKNRIKKLEEHIAMMQEILSHQQESITETQRYLIKVAHGQKELSKRVLSWPFIKVQTRKTKDV